jgi:hypothetical protein
MNKMVKGSCLLLYSFLWFLLFRVLALNLNMPSLYSRYSLHEDFDCRNFQIFLQLCYFVQSTPMV